jgi:hypothetical protein
MRSLRARAVVTIAVQATVALAILAASPPALAEQPAALAEQPPDPSSDAALTSTPGPKSPLKEPDKTRPRYWAQGDARAFTAIAVDVGYLYLRPRVSFGYGRPFWSWVGVDANPQVSNYFLGGYGGLRLALPMLDLRVGPRYVFAFQHHLLKPMPSYGRLDFESQSEARSKYLALEAEATSSIPAGPGSILFLASGSYVTAVPKGFNVYEETLRLIIAPPWVWRGRVGYAVRLGVEGKISFGVVTEVLGNPGRDLSIWRGGVIGSASLSNHIEVLGSLVLPILTPDKLGIFGGEFAQLGVRYRWATGQAADVPVEQFDRPDGQK